MRESYGDKLERLSLENKLSPTATRYVMQSNVPSTTANGRYSFTIRYPSAKNGNVVEVQSRDFEFPCLITLLANPDVEHVIAQPAELSLDHPNPRVRCYRPDFLVFWKSKSRPTIIETKPASKLASLALKHPDRYVATEPGKYDSPLHRKAIEALGFDFRIVHETHFCPTFLKNSRYLEPYQKWKIHDITPEEKTNIIGQILASPGVAFADIKHEDPRRKADLIHHLLAEGEIYTHLSEVPLTEHQKVRLYPSPIFERAFAIFNSEEPASPCEFPYELYEGMKFIMEGKKYTVSKISGAQIAIIHPDGKVVQLPNHSFGHLLSQIERIYNPRPTKEAQLRKLSEKDLTEMLRRYKLLEPLLASPKRTAGRNISRTLQRYMSAYTKSKALSGNGFYGLMPRFSDRGSKDHLLPELLHDKMWEQIQKTYHSANPRPTMQDAHEQFLNILRNEKSPLPEPSYRTFVRACHCHSEFNANLKRWGGRIAKQDFVPSSSCSPFGNPKGERPFSVGHCDSTVNDVALSNLPSERKLLKPVHTLIVDATTGKVIAHVTRLNAPSTETLIELFLDCVRRNLTIPTTLAVDWGADHRSTWLQQTMGSLLGVTIVYSQVSTARSNSPVEQKFNTNDRRLIHLLTGSTEIMRHVRKATGSVLPHKHAVWALEDLKEMYESHYKRLNSTPQGNQKLSPDELEKELWDAYGEHPRNAIPIPVLKRCLLPLAHGLVRVVDHRCRVSVNRSHYASDELRPVRGEKVFVRVDDENPKLVHVSHEKLKSLVDCYAVGADLKYATTREEAEKVLSLKNQKVPEVEYRKAESRKQATIERLEKEAALIAKKERVRKSQSKTTKAPAKSNVVPFEYTAGGLVNMFA